MKFTKSLQAKYMLIIITAIFLMFLAQMTIVSVSMFIMDFTNETDESKSLNVTDYEDVEKKWHEEASQIEDMTNDAIHDFFEKWQQQFPNASMFWVDGMGQLSEKMNMKDPQPSNWTSTYTAKFIKDRYGGDPYTVIAFVGEGENNGFVVLEIPRGDFAPPLQKMYDRYGVILVLGMLIIIILFIIVSYLFFRGIRRRILHLQVAMAMRDVNHLPIQIDVKNKDEIGQLEETFNQMVMELRESKEREQKEEQLRRELIANLSHDLRTPLTKISAQTYSLQKETMSPEAKNMVKTLETSIQEIDRLIENLMSYTLLMASKYQYRKEEIDVIRFVRKHLASWYPVFEKEGFEVDIELQPFKTKWSVDSSWLGRILDNLFQNVLRHANTGKYINVKSDSTDDYDAIIIKDQGKGMNEVSNEKGAGIGLSIVDMMVKGMNLDWEIDSSEAGTTIKIVKSK
ncbi:HAMP domain-containing sensor histidine kinase [Bacillaceae bacterium W0354]